MLSRAEPGGVHSGPRGWVQLLTGSAGWTSRRPPRGLSGLYMVAGALSLFVYLLPVLEGSGVALGIVMSIWQGILFRQRITR